MKQVRTYRFSVQSPSGCTIMINVLFDRRQYQQLIKGFLANPNNILFGLNTDGAAIFKSSKLSIWPVFLMINELPPNEWYVFLFTQNNIGVLYRQLFRMVTLKMLLHTIALWYLLDQLLAQKLRLNIEGLLDENTRGMRTRTNQTRHRRTIGWKSKNNEIENNVSPGYPELFMIQLCRISVKHGSI